MSKINLTIRVEPRLRARLDYVAARIGSSTPEVSRIALIEYVANWEAANRTIPEDDLDRRVKDILERLK